MCSWLSTKMVPFFTRGFLGFIWETVKFSTLSCTHSKQSNHVSKTIYSTKVNSILEFFIFQCVDDIVTFTSTMKTMMMTKTTSRCDYLLLTWLSWDFLGGRRADVLCHNFCEKHLYKSQVVGLNMDDFRWNLSEKRIQCIQLLKEAHYTNIEQDMVTSMTYPWIPAYLNPKVPLSRKRIAIL